MGAINTVPELLRAQASRIPDQPFVRWRGRSVSYGEFDARTDALAAGLADLGLQPGDVVSVMLPNRLEFLEAWWAILKAGAVFGAINPAFTATGWSFSRRYRSRRPTYGGQCRPSMGACTERPRPG